MKIKKEKIFDAVFETFLEGGAISKVTVGEIAKRAGIGKGSVYMYFANKDQMMFEAMKYFLESSLKNLLEYDVDESKGFKKLMLGFIAEHVAVLKIYSKMFYTTVSTEFFPELTESMRIKMVDVVTKIRDQHQNKMKILLAVGAKEGLVSSSHTSFELQVTSQMLFSASGYYAQEEVPIATENVDEYVSMMYDMAVKMLK